MYTNYSIVNISRDIFTIFAKNYRLTRDNDIFLFLASINTKIIKIFYLFTKKYNLGTKGFAM